MIALLIVSVKTLSFWFPGVSHFFSAFGLWNGTKTEKTLSKSDDVMSESTEHILSKVKGTPDSVFIHHFNGIYLAFYEASDAEKMAQHKLFGKRTIIPLLGRDLNAAAPGFTPSSLAEIYRFDEMMRAVQRHNPTHSIVLCAGVDSKVQSKAVFLAGCHMIMTQGFSYVDTVNTLANTTNTLTSVAADNEGLTVPCCWMALHRAKSLGWIDFGDVFDTGCDNPSRIFIEEYIHYAR